MLHTLLKTRNILIRRTHLRLLSTAPKFSDATNIQSHTRKAIVDMFNTKATMTEIQAETLLPGLAGDDILARARTGTGKTVAFLVPALQNLQGNSKVEVLCVSPTRELASQISEQATKMLKYHPNSKKPNVQTLFGGTLKPKRDTTLFQQNQPSVLVATPGRLLSHLREGTLGPKPFDSLKVLVLDEADQLLDHGFRKEIMELLESYVPGVSPKTKQDLTQRPQTLLFSATMPTGLRAVMAKAMRPNFTTVDCIGDDDTTTQGAGATHAHDQVQQHHILTETNEDIIHASFDLLRTIIEKGNEKERTKSIGLIGPDPKMIVFLPTANLTKFYASLWAKTNEKNRKEGYRSYEMHSRKSQKQRSRVQNIFKDVQSGILFSSDVSARGVDYPGVTHVVQIGSPPSVEQYVHRLGRTGRAGKKGTGILILTPFEKHFLTSLKSRGITCNTNTHVDILKSNVEQRKSLDQILQIDAKKETGSKKDFEAGKAYQSALGGLMGGTWPKSVSRPSKQEFVQYANSFAVAAGYADNVMPELLARTVGKMGLKGVSNLNIVKGDVNPKYIQPKNLPKKKKKKKNRYI